MKKVVAFACFLVLLLTFVFPVTADRYEGEGFSSPEEAAGAYVEYMNKGNIQGMISCFAVETYVEHVDTDLFLEDLGAVNFYTMHRVVTENEYVHSLMTTARYSFIAQSVLRRFIKSTFEDTEFSGLAEGQMVAIEDKEAREAFYEAIEQSPLIQGIGKTKVISFLDPAAVSEKYSLEPVQKNREKYRNRYGCDEYVDVCCYFEIDGVEHLQCFGCGKYGKNWYLLEFGGLIGTMLGLSSYDAGMT